MKVYHFDTVEDGVRKFDGKGVQLPSDRAARDKAAATMASLARQAILDGRDTDFLIEVRNEHGLVCRLSFG